MALLPQEFCRSRAEATKQPFCSPQNDEASGFLGLLIAGLSLSAKIWRSLACFHKRPTPIMLPAFQATGPWYFDSVIRSHHLTPCARLRLNPRVGSGFFGFWGVGWMAYRCTTHPQSSRGRKCLCPTTLDTERLRNTSKLAGVGASLTPGCRPPGSSGEVRDG